MKFHLPKRPDLPSPEDIAKKFQEDFEQIKYDLEEFKVGMGDLEVPSIDWDAVADVTEALLEYMNDTKGNCDKIPHGKKVDPEVDMTPVS
jgi:hypothetical protein